MQNVNITHAEAEMKRKEYYSSKSSKNDCCISNDCFSPYRFQAILNEVAVIYSLSLSHSLSLSLKLTSCFGGLQAVIQHLKV